MKVVLICLVILVCFFVSRQGEKTDAGQAISTDSERLIIGDCSLSAPGTKSRILNRYVLLKEAFTTAAQMDYPGQDKTGYFAFHSFLSFVFLPADRFCNGFYIGKYTDILSARYQAGYYLFFLKKLLI